MVHIYPTADEPGYVTNGLSGQEDPSGQLAKAAECILNYIWKLHLTPEEENKRIITGELIKDIEQECGINISQFSKYFGILRKNEASMGSLGVSCILKLIMISHFSPHSDSTQ